MPQALPAPTLLSLGTALPAARNVHAGKAKISKTTRSTALPGSGTGQDCLPGDLQDGHPGRGCPISIITETVGVFSLVLARHLCRHGPRRAGCAACLPAAPAGHSHAPHCCLCWGCCRTRPFETLPGITGISGRLGMYIQPGAHLCLAEHWLYAQGCQQHSSRAEQQRGSHQQQGSQGEERVPWKSHLPQRSAPRCTLLPKLPLSTSIKLQG